MKTLRMFSLNIAFITCLASCQNNADVKKVVWEADISNQIVNTITDNSFMPTEMNTAMITDKNFKIKMIPNQKLQTGVLKNNDLMIKIIVENTCLAQSMVSSILETSEADNKMMVGICKTIMENQPMMDMIEKMKNEKPGLNKMEALHYNSIN